MRRRSRATGEAALRETTPAMFEPESGVINLDIFGRVPGERVDQGEIPTLLLAEMTVAEAEDRLADSRSE